MLYLLNILTTVVFADYSHPYYSQAYQPQAYQPSYYNNSYYDNRGYETRSYNSRSSFYRQPQARLSDTDILNAKIEALNEIRESIYKSHQMCLSRIECQGMDKQILSSIRARHQRATHLNSFFTDFDQQLSKAYNSVAATEWDVYNSLSEEAKQQYQAGVRLNDLRSVISKPRQDNSYQSRRSQYSAKAAPQFILDDLKIYILQQFEATHQNCGSREACLQSDNRIIDGVIKLLGPEDPMRADLSQLKDTISLRAKQSFDTSEFIESYYSSLVEKIPFFYRDKERVDWINFAKTFKVGQRRNPRLLNQQEIEEAAKPENELKQHVKDTAKDAGKKAVDDLFGAVLGGKSGNKDLGLFGKLFGR